MDNKYCCLCETSVKDFLPWEGDSEFVFLNELKCVGSDTKNFYCPNCRATDRDRHLWLYINKIGLYQALNPNNRIMHIAPEMPIIYRLLKKTLQIVVGDLYPEKYKNGKFEVKKIDLTSIDYPDNSFNLFIANHILEHIIDYKTALKEIYRVLTIDGIAILQTPYSPVIYNHFEDPKINTDEAREKFYGQKNHVRLFGEKLFDDIRESGFNVQLLEHGVVLKEYDPIVYGTNPDEGLILAMKKK